MRLTLRLLGVTVIDLEACDDCTCNTDELPSLRPPFGFAGSGTGIASWTSPQTGSSTRSRPTAVAAETTYLTCRWHGCTRQATVIVVTWDGWCTERCEPCAYEIVDRQQEAMPCGRRT